MHKSHSHDPTLFNANVIVMSYVMLGFVFLKVIGKYRLLFLMLLIFTAVFVRTEKILKTTISKMIRTSSYYFKKPSFLLQWGHIMLTVCGLSYWSLQSPLLRQNTLMSTILNTCVKSLIVFSLASAAKCYMIGTEILPIKYIRHGFFAIFARAVVLLRCLFCTSRWFVQICGESANTYQVLSLHSTIHSLFYLVIKIILFGWLVYDFIQSIRKYKVNSEVALKPAPKEKCTEPCIVCMNDIVEGVQLDCGDVFCYKCARKWLSISPVCPLCRRSIRVPKKLELSDGYIPLGVVFSIF